MKYEKELNNFISYMNYKSDSDLEGIILYGSSQTNLDNEFSDIDIMIIFNDKSKREQIKGVLKIDNKTFEYFERTISSIYKRIDNEFSKNEDSAFSIFGFGTILYDPNGEMRKIKEYTLKKYKDGLPKLEKNEIDYKINSFNNAINSLLELSKEKNPDFQIFYYVTLNKMREFYHNMKGYSKLSNSKITKIYKNEEVRNMQHKTIPEQEFIDIYYDALLANDDIDKLKKINVLFKYITKEYNYNFDNIRINIKGKNY